MQKNRSEAEIVQNIGAQEYGGREIWGGGGGSSRVQGKHAPSEIWSSEWGFRRNRDVIPTTEKNSSIRG